MILSSQILFFRCLRFLLFRQTIPLPFSFSLKFIAFGYFSPFRFNCPFLWMKKLSWFMEAIKKQAQKLREQVAKQQQVSFLSSYSFIPNFLEYLLNYACNSWVVDYMLVQSSKVCIMKWLIIRIFFVVLQAVLKHLGHLTSDSGLVDDAEPECHQRLQNLYMSTRAAKVWSSSLRLRFSIAVLFKILLDVWIYCSIILDYPFPSAFPISTFIDNSSIQAPDQRVFRNSPRAISIFPRVW